MRASVSGHQIRTALDGREAVRGVAATCGQSGGRIEKIAGRAETRGTGGGAADRARIRAQICGEPRAEVEIHRCGDGAAGGPRDGAGERHPGLLRGTVQGLSVWTEADLAEHGTR